MLNFSQLTQDQLSRPETLQAVKAEAFDLIDHLMVPESKKLAEQLEDRLKTLPGLASQAPEIYSQYQKMIVHLRLSALMALENNAILELIQKNYLDSFDAGLDLNERMTGKMYSVPDLVWPEYAEQIAYALKQNIQKIGQRTIVVRGETEPKPPTIQNWLSDYDRTLGPDLKTDLEQEEYLAKNPNAKLLDPTEKAKLRNVLRFYNNLKPIPTAIIDKALKEAGVYDELAKEYPEAMPSSPAYIVTEPTIIQAPKRYARPEGIRDQYLEPIEEKPQTKPAPYVPQTQKPSLPTQPAYTRPIQPAPAPAPFPPQQQPQIPQDISPSPQTRFAEAEARRARGGAPPEAGQRGAEIPSTPPPVEGRGPHGALRPAPSSSEEGRITDRPTPQYPQPQPLQQPIQQPNHLTPQSFPLQKDSYLEPIDIPEIPERPTPPASSKPQPDPRLQGNIVDLKNPEK